MAVYAVILGPPWGLFLFLALALAILCATDRWMAALGFWSNEGEKSGGSPLRVLLAALSTAAAVGAWYALAFVALPSGS